MAKPLTYALQLFPCFTHALLHPLGISEVCILVTVLFLTTWYACSYIMYFNVFLVLQALHWWSKTNKSAQFHLQLLLCCRILDGLPLVDERPGLLQILLMWGKSETQTSPQVGRKFQRSLMTQTSNSKYLPKTSSNPKRLRFHPSF